MITVWSWMTWIPSRFWARARTWTACRRRAVVLRTRPHRHLWTVRVVRVRESNRFRSRPRPAEENSLGSWRNMLRLFASWKWWRQRNNIRRRRVVTWLVQRTRDFKAMLEKGPTGGRDQQHQHQHQHQWYRHQRYRDCSFAEAALDQGLGRANSNIANSVCCSRIFAWLTLTPNTALCV